VTADDRISVTQLSNYKITGFGGSDMSPAMEFLAMDPDVESVIVITDGAIDYPHRKPPYAVFWVLPPGDVNWWFTPDYGVKIPFELPRNCMNQTDETSTNG
jgi:predicted metal-dependent peptidase